METLAELRTKLIAEHKRMCRGGIESLQLVTALMYGFYAALFAGTFLLICVIRPTPLPTVLTSWLGVVVRHSAHVVLIMCCVIHGCAGLVIGWRIGDRLYRLVFTHPRAAAALLYPIFFVPFVIVILANLFLRYGALPAKEVRSLVIIGVLGALTYALAVRRWLRLRQLREISSHVTPDIGTLDQ